MAKVTVKGLKKLERQLKYLPDQIYDGAKAATTESVTAVYKDMRSRVPRQSGQLHGAIGRRVRGALRGEVGVFGAKRAWWAALVEFGTSRTAAQPFAHPAAEAEAPKYSDRLRRHVGSALDKLR
ncbi:HK97-gp10 family putative phage morphogenesis protein [Nocardiopsis lucentensis]|uniref:HK97-gp10 family putative phage morphogenesis protein n=1 Tax=Nocardiopsis lucentensis TaxID=53441 RepID=UPI000372DC0D|nr:HK97-gp10 family putative phage morphogenesis protein [Nocardiopsis lucentensis]